MRPRAPHFALPFRIEDQGFGTTARVLEQDTADEIFDCVKAVVAYKPGDRIEKPDFGMPDQTFSEGGVDVDEVTQAVLHWEPRAELLIQSQPDRLDEMISNTRVDVRAGSIFANRSEGQSL